MAIRITQPGKARYTGLMPIIKERLIALTEQVILQRGGTPHNFTLDLSQYGCRLRRWSADAPVTIGQTMFIIVGEGNRVMSAEEALTHWEQLLKQLPLTYQHQRQTDDSQASLL